MAIYYPCVIVSFLHMTCILKEKMHCNVIQLWSHAKILASVIAWISNRLLTVCRLKGFKSFSVPTT